MPFIHDTNTLRRWLRRLGSKLGVELCHTTAMMTKVYKRTNLVVNTVKCLRNGCQQQAYLGKEWHIQLQSGEFRIQREVALEAKVKATSTERDNLVKENERLKKSTDRLKRQVTSLADQVRISTDSRAFTEPVTIPMYSTPPTST